MALARVQVTPFSFVSGTSITITFPSTPAVGNAIIIGVISSSGIITATDNRGNTYSFDATIVNGSNVCSFLSCSSIVTTGSPFTITVSSTAFNNLGASAIEISGSVGGLIFTRSGSGTGTSTTPGTTATTALITDSVFAVAMHSCAGAQTTITVQSVSPTWTQEYERLTNPASEMDSRVLTGVIGTTQSCAWVNSTSLGWSALFAVYSSLADLPLAPIRVSQDAIETLVVPFPNLRVSQLVIETLESNFATLGIRVTQDVIETLLSNPIVIVSTEKTQFFIILP